MGGSLLERQPSRFDTITWTRRCVCRLHYGIKRSLEPWMPTVTPFRGSSRCGSKATLMLHGSDLYATRNFLRCVSQYGECEQFWFLESRVAATLYYGPRKHN